MHNSGLRNNRYAYCVVLCSQQPRLGTSSNGAIFHSGRSSKKMGVGQHQLRDSALVHAARVVRKSFVALTVTAPEEESILRTASMPQCGQPFWASDVCSSGVSKRSHGREPLVLRQRYGHAIADRIIARGFSGKDLLGILLPISPLSYRRISRLDTAPCTLPGRRSNLAFRCRTASWRLTRLFERRQVSCSAAATSEIGDGRYLQNLCQPRFGIGLVPPRAQYGTMSNDHR
ncbi:hypothetical protein GE09DRAFT_214979 [Coniochaeta sp. 2T2.1]|nr:hypothetical protein GE09DRAFT_214979 [Coniochaeta sp. 2T2.1]